MEAETGTVIGAGHGPLLGIATEGPPEVQFLKFVGFLDRCRNLNLKEVDLNIPRLR